SSPMTHRWPPNVSGKFVWQMVVLWWRKPMRWRDQLYQASLNLTAAKLRSILAILGILVGTAAVVALISSGQLATAKALEQFKSLGTDLMAVSVYQQRHGKSGDVPQYPSLRDWRDMAERMPEVLDIAPYVTTYQ